MAVSLLVILHIALGALWLGTPLYAGPLLKRAAELDQAAALQVAQAANRSVTITAVSILGVLLSGVGLIFLRFGGFGGAPPRFHIAMTLVLVATVIGFAVLKPTVNRVVTAASGGDYEGSMALAAGKRLSMVTGITHLLWLGSLTLMYMGPS